MLAEVCSQKRGLNIVKDYVLPSFESRNRALRWYNEPGRRPVARTGTDCDTGSPCQPDIRCEPDQYKLQIRPRDFFRKGMFDPRSTLGPARSSSCCTSVSGGTCTAILADVIMPPLACKSAAIFRYRPNRRAPPPLPIQLSAAGQKQPGRAGSKAATLSG
jgi:hypothetical protein